MKQPENVLTAVLDAHGGTCTCRGACGKEHTGDGKRCGAKNSGKGKPLLAAPHTARPTDAQNAAAPVEDLRPWCWSCWCDAYAAERDRVNAQRAEALVDMQMGLFDVAGTAA